MFGGYRFFLAMLVALSHFGFQAAAFNPQEILRLCRRTPEV
jgi:hypothetical protein